MCSKHGWDAAMLNHNQTGPTGSPVACSYAAIRECLKTKLHRKNPCHIIHLSFRSIRKTSTHRAPSRPQSDSANLKAMKGQAALTDKESNKDSGFRVCHVLISSTP